MFGNSEHRLKRVVEYGDGTFGVEECIGAGNWVSSTGTRFGTEKKAREWINENTVKRIIAS